MDTPAKLFVEQLESLDAELTGDIGFIEKLIAENDCHYLMAFHAGFVVGVLRNTHKEIQDSLKHVKSIYHD